MKYSAILLSLLFFFSAVGFVVAGNHVPDRKDLITAEDLLRLKGLSPYSPASQSASGKTDLVTAEDLLRIKGLLKEKDKNGKQKGKEKNEDIWGLEKDLGC